MLRCVEFLVGHGADLFIENSNGQTACDLAVACGHHQVLKTHLSKCNQLPKVHSEKYFVIALVSSLHLITTKIKALKHGQVALLLETHMVFSSGAETAANEEEAPNQEVSRWISLYCY